MNQQKIILQFKNITNSPRLAILFLTTLNNLRELYCLSSVQNNWKNYINLIKVIKRCSTYNIHPLLSYLNTTEQSLFSSLEKRGNDFNVDSQEDLLHYQYCNRISKGIENIHEEIVSLKKNLYWIDVFKYTNFTGISFLPKKSSFENKQLIAICKKYHFFELKLDIWNNEHSLQKIDNAFNDLCITFGIKNFNLGHNDFSVYIGEFYNEYNLSVYRSDGKYTMLNNISAFTHEWGHYLDNRAFHDSSDLHYMVKNNIESGYHSDLICYKLNVKPKHIKYYSLYQLLRKLILNEHNFKPTKFYKICQNYETSRKNKEYWSRMTEIFARLIEVFIAHKNKNTILTCQFSSYENWEIYPKINILEPIYKDLYNFIQLSTDNK